MTRRTHAQAADEAVAADRAAVLAYADRYCAQVDGLLRKKMLTAAEASLLKRRIKAFAENVAAGVHVE